MSKSKFTENQIVGILGECEAGLPVAELYRKHGISNATYYQLKSKCTGVSASELSVSRSLVILLFSKGLRSRNVMQPWPIAA
jgi:putative transposase